MKVHYTAPYLLNPSHKVSVNVIGAGGTGSQVITALARINEALKALGHPGLHVTVFDDDLVSDANIGRQLFSPQDVGQFKASVLVTRINRYFGYNWQSHNLKYSNENMINFSKKTDVANINITCVDSAKSRIEIGKILKGYFVNDDEYKPYYWLDFGNDKKIGQIVLGTLSEIEQPKSKHITVAALSTTLQLFDWKKIKTKDSGPSCSIAEALNKQDLFINSTLANLGMSLLWQLFREGKITHHGLYLNLETMKTNPINL